MSFLNNIKLSGPAQQNAKQTVSTNQGYNRYFQLHRKSFSGIFKCIFRIKFEILKNADTQQNYDI